MNRKKILGCSISATAKAKVMGWRDNDEASSAIIYTGLNVC